MFPSSAEWLNFASRTFSAIAPLDAFEKVRLFWAGPLALAGCVRACHLKCRSLSDSILNSRVNTRYLCRLLFCSVLGAVIGLPFAVSKEPARQERPKIAWLDDYHAAMTAARAGGKSVLIWFHDESQIASARFESEVLRDPTVVERVGRSFVAAGLPLDAATEIDGTASRLLQHAAFAELGGGPGLAIIDLTDQNSSHYGYVVSVYPLTSRSISAEHLGMLLDLPSGSLTQRTMIFAVRTHADRPASATGPLDPLLAGEAESHSRHQANIDTQGHHDWDRRFQAINARLPAGHVAYEVCAESWPGQSLVEAAEECVDSWRQSSGHWRQVSTQAEYYGYDMSRGAGGVWYATGIFGRRRN